MANLTEKSIFLNALDETSEGARELYLQSACGDDAKLRAAVESLLDAHLRPAHPLDSPLISETIKLKSLAEPPPVTSDVGRTIGPYRIMEQIGEGGFGLVFVAQQKHPVKRNVALKIIKPGTGSKEILARFDAERQAVAMMNHPHITQIFDAGVTNDARPYFVMELVRGVPITDFFQQHPLTLDQKLELFIDVCSATHHAHQKGVIHRDLKPSNVLVTLHDDKPVVKVIDFGIAKAIGPTLTDQTIYTRFFSMIGTPLYMSPEQAAMNGLDIDIRSDIYSLGMLLYQLLTGTTPFDQARLSSAGYDEVRRIIREEDPPKPSTRLTETRHTKTNTLANHPSRRTSQPNTWTEYSVAGKDVIPSDLDWIVMKAIEKDRQCRYESASAMADDLKRFLRNEPIEARPPSRRYLLAKFARRNRIALITGSLVASALVIGSGVSLDQANRAITARNQKEVALRDAIEARNSASTARQEVEQFAERLKAANSLMGSARSNEESQQLGAADQAYSTAVELVPNYYLVWIERARLRAKLSLWTEAAADFSAGLELEAPVNHNQWNGAAALFLLTERTNDVKTLMDRLLHPQSDSATQSPTQSLIQAANGEMDATQSLSLGWNSIRSCLISPTPPIAAQRLVEQVETLLAANQRRPPRRPDNRNIPPEDRPDNRREGRPNRSTDFFADTIGPLFGGPPPGRQATA